MKRFVAGLAVLALAFALPAAAQSGAWSSVGSTGSVDETSLAIFAVNGPSMQFLPTATGTVFARYNVTNTFGGGLTDTPAWNTLEMTYFDPSPSSALAATLFRVDHCTGVTSILCTVSSADATTNSCKVCNFPPGSINFGTSLYFIELRLSRSVTTVNPQLIGLRIF